MRKRYFFYYNNNMEKCQSRKNFKVSGKLSTILLYVFDISQIKYKFLLYYPFLVNRYHNPLTILLCQL